MKKAAISFLWLLLFIGIASAQPVVVSVNQTYTLDQTSTTPFVVWEGAILLGLGLIILSFLHFPAGEESLISVLSWFPLGYALYTSFAVDMVTGAVGAGVLSGGTPEFVMIQNHNIYHFDVIAVILLVIMVFAIGNTYRIVLNMKRIREMAEPEQTWHERHPPMGSGGDE